MNRKLFLLLSLLFTSISFSQQAKIDSLSQIFHYEKEDSIKVRILAEIGEVAYSMNIEFAKQINDSLLSYAKGRSEKYLAQAYKVNGTFFLLEGNFDNALKYYKQSLKIFKKLNDKKNEAVVVGNFGTLYGRKGDIEESKKYHLQAIKINNEINNEEGNIKPYLNLAIAAGNESNFEESIEYLIKALSIAEVYNSNQNLPYIYNQIAINYLKLDSYDEAEKYLQKGLEISQKSQDSYAQATIHNSIAYLYETRDEDFVNSLFHYEKALEYYSLLNNSTGMITCYYNVGLQHLRFKSFLKARNSFLAGLELSNSIQSFENIIVGNLSLQQLSIEMGEIEKANQYRKNIEMNLSEQSMLPYKNHFYRIGQAYSNKQLYKSAYENINLYAILADSLFKKEGVQKVAEISTKYQTEKKEKENLVLKKKNAEQELAVQQATNLNQRYGFIALTAVLGVFGIFYYSKNRRRKLRDEHIINIAQAKQKEHEKIGADLHSTKTKDLEKIASNLEEKGEVVMASKVREVKDSIRLLSHELFQIPFSQLEFDDQIINLLFDYNSDSLKISHEGIHTIQWAQVDNTIKRNLYLIISEAISNVKNHSKASTASVKFKKTNKNIDVLITDNGIGFTDDQLKRGHGVGNMRMRVNEINGNMRFDSVKNKGSEIEIFVTAF